MIAPDRSSHPTGWPPPAAGWYAVATLWFAYVISYVDRLVITFLIDPIKRDLNVSDTEISLLIGLSFALFYSIVGLPIARYADRGHRVRLIVLGIVVWSAMTAACGLANGFLMLFVARIGVAIGEAVLQPSALSLISDFFPRDRKAVPISTYLTASFAGIAVAYIAGGGLLSIAERWDRSGIPLLQTMQPWQVVFLMVSIPSFLAAVLVSLIREPRRQERLRTDLDADQSIPLRELITIARQNLGTYATIIGGPLLVCMYVFALTVWLPSVLTRVHGMSSTEAGAMIGTCFFIGGPIGALGASFLAKMLAKRGHRDAVVRAALYCNLLALLPGVGVAFAPSGTLTVVCFFIFAIVGAGMTTLPQAALQMVAPNEVRSQFAAVWGLFVNVFGLGFGPTIAALISDTLSPDGSQIQTALAIMAVPLLLLSALSIYAGLPSVRRCFEKLNSNA